MPEYIVEADVDEQFSTSYDTFNTEFMKPIVRCKDCRFMEEHENECALCLRHRMTTWYGGFCAWGERK